MEQVFDVVNTVLHQDRQTKRRELGVRGYKVIPLDSQSGVIEFVKDTSPLKDWLVVAHRKWVDTELVILKAYSCRPRYRPQDMLEPDIRSRHMKVLEMFRKNADQQKLLDVFYENRSKFRPVMRHYFTEKSTIPATWFAMRLKYTRSVATTSIVGHILGLGDRHTSNILLDNRSGEVVHIDLGIAFEQVFCLIPYVNV
jgi:ataxia telangiectasia mutated family protein